MGWFGSSPPFYGLTGYASDSWRATEQAGHHSRANNQSRRQAFVLRPTVPCQVRVPLEQRRGAAGNRHSTPLPAPGRWSPPCTFSARIASMRATVVHLCVSALCQNQLHNVTLAARGLKKMAWEIKEDIRATRMPYKNT